MPGMNRQGPDGTGSRTGGGRGICRRTGEAASPLQGQGQGRGRGQGQGSGRGLGQGRGGSAVGPVTAAPDIRPGQVYDAEKNRDEVNQKILEDLMARMEQLEAGRTREG
jgi:hypothetical protein